MRSISLYMAWKKFMMRSPGCVGLGVKLTELFNDFSNLASERPFLSLCTQRMCMISSHFGINFDARANVTVGKVLHGRHQGDDLEDILRPSPDQWREFYRKLYEESPNELVALSKKNKRSFRCRCAVSSFAVASNGDVYPCIGVPWTAGSIYNNSLSEIWKDSNVFREIRALKQEDFQRCNSCSIKEYCERIAPSAYISSGSYTGYDPRQCEQAQAHADYVGSLSLAKQGGLDTP